VRKKSEAYIALETCGDALFYDSLDSRQHPLHPSSRPTLLTLCSAERQERNGPELRLGSRLLGRAAWTGGDKGFVGFKVGEGGRVGGEDREEVGELDALGGEEGD
jgi:hypothetical protein